LFKVFKTVEFYILQEEVKPSSISLAIHTPQPETYGLTPEDRIIIEIGGFEECSFKGFYPMEPERVEEFDGRIRLSWHYAKPKFTGNPNFLWGVCFKVDGGGKGSVNDFSVMEWCLKPEETDGRGLVDLWLKYKLKNDAISTAIIGPIPSEKPGAKFFFERDLEQFTIDVTPSKTAYGDIQTLVSRRRPLQGIVDLNVKIRVNAWKREELLIGGRVEVESEDYPFKTFIEKLGREVELPGKTTLMYGLPDLRIVCKPSSFHPLII
jgi:hypothetical protein